MGKDIFEICVHFKRVLLENQTCNYINIFCILLFSICFYPCKFCEIAPISFGMVIFTKIWKCSLSVLNGGVEKC